MNEPSARMTTVRFGLCEIKADEAFRTGMLMFGELSLDVEAASALLRPGTETENPVEQALEPKKNGRRYGFPITLLYHATA